MERNAFFDNARLLLITLVVFGHIIQPITFDSKSLASLYTWIYTFHMPAFIMIAGYFAKGSSDSKYLLTLVKKLLIPYVIFQIVYTGYYFLIDKKDWLIDSIFYPHWSLWFLFSLFCWHMLLILYKHVRPVVGIVIAIIIGVTIGYFDSIGHMFSLSRTFVFFPYFLIGYWISEQQMMALKRVPIKIASLVVMTVFAVAIYYLPDVNTDWLLASKSYGALGVEWGGSLFRFTVYMTSLLMAFSVLAWIPKRRFSFTKLGERTLYVYLLHGFIVQYLRQEDIIQVTNIFDFIGVIAITIIIVFLLSSKFFMTVTEPMIELSTRRWNDFKNRDRDAY